jgi:ADP-ribose pyrophosphatase YjhB (NUDIX family)
MNYIRGKSVAIIEHENRYLFTVCFDQTTDKVFYIPIGGGIAFGEHSREAAKREVAEETGREVTNLQLLDVSENIFTFNGVNEHEIVFVYKADFLDQLDYKSEITGNLNDRGDTIKLIWSTLNEIREKGIQLYPFNLLQVLQQSKTYM